MKFLICITLCILLRYTEAACYSGSDPASCTSCGGGCDSNGCFCADGATSCVPDNSDQCPTQSNDCCITDWYWDSVSNCCSDVKQCGPPCKIDESCDITGTPTCVCNGDVYNGITTSDLNPTVKCDSGTMITSVNKCRLQKLGYDYSTLHLADASINCTYTYPDYANNVWSLQAKAAIGWCGNFIEEESSQIYFTNTIFINPIPGPLITKNPISYNMTCMYNMTMQTSLDFALHPIISSVLIKPSDGTGTFTVIMAAYSNEACTEPLDQDAQVVIGTNFYIGVFSPDADGATFALKAETCFANPSGIRNDTNNVQLVTGGSAVPGDVEVVVLQNGDSLEDRIQVSSFKFQGFDNVYIFCDVRLCNKTSGCNGNGRSGDTVYEGPVINVQFRDDSYLNSAGYHTAASWAVLAASLLTFLTNKLF